jgi:glycosyltransferase involved in cell wall biosynthesis
MGPARWNDQRSADLTGNPSTITETALRTLFISRCVPEPLNTGTNQRVFHLLKALSKVSDVTFVSATRDGVQDGVPVACGSFCKEIIFFPNGQSGWQSDAQLPLPIRKWRGMKRRLKAAPVLFQWYSSTEEASFLKSLCSQDFDLIWMERLFFLSLVPSTLKARVLIDLDDLEHRKLRRELKLQEMNRNRLLSYLEFMKLRRLELNLLKRPCELIVCSETDKRILGGGPRVWVVPNGVHVPPRSAEKQVDATGPAFLFVGYMAYKANIDAVQWFATEILSLILRSQPNAKFLIVGREPDPAVRKLHDDKTVFVTGTVPEVEPFLRQASVVVTPLRSGAGTRIKILEAMAYRRPVVSTSIGAEGLEVESGRHLLIANSASDFANSCVRLARDRSVRRELVNNAFALVTRKYDWSKIQAKVTQIVAPSGHCVHARREENLCLRT